MVELEQLLRDDMYGQGRDKIRRIHVRRLSYVPVCGQAIIMLASQAATTSTN